MSRMVSLQRSRTASASKAQRAMMRRVTGLNGLCSIMRTAPLGCNGRSISVTNPCRTAGGMWCRTQLAKTASNELSATQQARIVITHEVRFGCSCYCQLEGAQAGVDAAQRTDATLQ